MKMMGTRIPPAAVLLEDFPWAELGWAVQRGRREWPPQQVPIYRQNPLPLLIFSTLSLSPSLAPSPLTNPLPLLSPLCFGPCQSLQRP